MTTSLQDTFYTKIRCQSAAQFCAYVQSQEARIRHYRLRNDREEGVYFYAALTDIPCGKRALYVKVDTKSPDACRFRILFCRVVDIIGPFSPPLEIISSRAAA